VDRECNRHDIDPDVWAEFFLELVSQRTAPDAYSAIHQILQGPQKAKFLLPGRPITWSGEICHYEPIDRFILHSLNLVIGGERTLERIGSLIEDGRCGGDALEGRRLGRADRPYWVTNDALRAEPESDRVRDRLGLRSLSRAGYRLVEIRYRYSYLAEKGIEIQAPTVLDSWQDDPKRSWLFAKRPEADGGPEAGRTVDISSTDGSAGAPEAVHKWIGVEKGDGFKISLRILKATTGPPNELSLVGLLRNQVI
jgi:hypothetical protein